ncbi:glycosyl transferase family 1 [Cupriavidus sp. USMAA2-4]|uniref:Glycosyl transferase family 1 n=1 Tax=Cupriavidus malaysiensis TaxID=367825 RepID=A0A1D9I5F4_9BURK|nr:MULTISPECIES: glycosyltransferase [Cupriavidus]AOY93024.1 glycosyl transferase family 1 [Cupriavidus sp. USMAA2-4]AOZ07319.1 glycosyl transferase family 1 [Cupriavidus malaysiensis]
MRILLLTTGLKLGGAEQQVAALARQFIAMGHAVAVVSLTPGQGVRLPDAATLLQLQMSKTPMSMAKALWQLHAFVRKWRPEIIHAHMVHANLLARALAATGNTPPVICTAHSAREGGRLRMLAYRVTDRWANLTTHVSPQGRLAMVSAGAVPAARIAVMPNGIDTSLFRPDPAARSDARAALGLSGDTRLLLNVGRLAREKAQTVLIDAFARLLSEPGTHARLMIVGEGPERPALEQRICQHRLDGLVTLAGVRHDVPALLNAADLFVLSSEIEGMPLVVGEALSCGRPVVSTDAAGVAELLGECGEIVPRGDVPALAAAMHRALAAGLGSAQEQTSRRQRVLSHFSLEAVATEWLACYEHLARTEPD